MGSDDLFHKRKARQTAVTRRKQARAERPRILIVCEDEKSSRFYLLGLVKELRLSTVDIIHGNSNPSSILEVARYEYTVASQRGDAYDRVYCVFDRDSHVTFDNTCQELKQCHEGGYKKSNIKIPSKVFFPAITTTPCYEFWLLLHFTYSTKPYHSTGAQSPCDTANSDLKSHHPKYDKADKGIFQKLKDKLPVAIQNAKQLATNNQQTQSTDPHTNFHELVEYLQTIYNTINSR